MNANLQNAIAVLSASNPSMLPTILGIMQTQGEDKALELANMLMGAAAGGAQAPQMYAAPQMMPQQPTSYVHGNLVVVPWDDGQLVNACVIGKDVNKAPEFGTREGWYVVLCEDFVTKDGHKYTDSMSSFPADMIWPNTEHGRMAAQLRANKEVQELTAKKQNKAAHRVELLAGIPYSEEQLKAMPQSDKVSVLTLLGLNTFQLKGDRVPLILDAQKTFLKSAEGKFKIAEAKGTVLANAPKAATTPKKVVAAPQPPKSAAKVAAPAPKVVAAPAKKVAAVPPTIRKAVAAPKK